MNRPPLQMTPAEIISEISDLRLEMDRRLARMHGLAQGLYHQARRAPVDDNTSVYVTYANAWLRFSGMAGQGIKRTASASKVLRQLSTPSEKPKAEPVRKMVQQRDELADQSPMDSLIEMYRDPITNEGAPAGSPDEASSDDAASVMTDG